MVITGGTSGVGRAVARRFAVDGAHVTVLARDTRSSHSARVATWLGGTGIQTLALAVVVSATAAIARAR